MDFLKANFFNIVGVISLIVGILAFIDGRSAKKAQRVRKLLESIYLMWQKKTLIKS